MKNLTNTILTIGLIGSLFACIFATVSIPDAYERDLNHLYVFDVAGSSAEAYLISAFIFGLIALLSTGQLIKQINKTKGK